MQSFLGGCVDASDIIKHSRNSYFPEILQQLLQTVSFEQKD